MNEYYDNMRPSDKEAYLAENGWHFNKKACEDAVRYLKKKSPSGKAEPLDAWTKTQVDELLQKFGVKLERSVGYDYVYVANMLKSDNFKGSIPDEGHLAMGVKEAIDDIDAAEGEIFACWYAKMIKRGIPVDWGAYL